MVVWPAVTQHWNPQGPWWGWWWTPGGLRPGRASQNFCCQCPCPCSELQLTPASAGDPPSLAGDKNGGEPDDAELVRLSKRLVENAVLKAVQQYLEETQNKNKPGDGSSVKTEEADRNGTDSDNNRK